MKDRHKFRCWDNVTKAYVSGYDKWKLYIDCGVSINDVWATGDVELEQCTGRKDKNGKLIYEGDVVLRSNGYKHMDYKKIVQFVASNQFPCYPALDEHEEGGTYWDIEIIGNIHEGATK